MAIPKTDRWVDKAKALRILKGMNGCSTEEYAGALRTQKFQVGDLGNKDREKRKKAWKRAYQVLQRLQRQGLVARIPQGTHQVKYELRTRGGPRIATRNHDAYTWEITLKGKARMKFLESEAS